MNRLTFIEYVGVKTSPYGGKKRLAKYRCLCGSEVVAVATKVRTGRKRSCGCLSKERLIKQNTTHGRSKTRLYTIYRGMIQRCENTSHPSYKYYGAKGISVCNDWRNCFDTFYKWAISNGYKKNLLIDRIDNDKGYTPENCRWVTLKESNRNKSNVKLSAKKVKEIRQKYQPRKYTQQQLAKEYNVASSLISQIISNKIWT